MFVASSCINCFPPSDQSSHSSPVSEMQGTVCHAVVLSGSHPAYVLEMRDVVETYPGSNEDTCREYLATLPGLHLGRVIL